MSARQRLAELRILRTAIASAFTKESGMRELIEELLRALRGGEAPDPGAEVKNNQKRHIAALQQMGGR